MMGRQLIWRGIWSLSALRQAEDVPGEDFGIVYFGVVADLGGIV